MASIQATMANGAARARREPKPHQTGGTFPLVKLGKGLTARLMELTPALAAEWLKKNPRVQRHRTQTNVDMIARAIEAGEWCVNGATVVFGTDGRLYDGQHRLAAVVQTGKTVLMLVIWGIDPAAFSTIDVARPRTGAQVLRAAGYAYADGIAGAVQILWRIERGLPFGRGVTTRHQRLKLSPPEILDYVAAHPQLRHAAYAGQRVWNVVHSVAAPTAAYHLLSRRDRDDADRFFDLLSSGAGLERNSPILGLRERLFREGRAAGDIVHKERSHADEIFSVMVLTWNRWRRKQPFNPADLRPEPSRPLPPIV